VSTRTIKECQDLAKAWLAGKKKQVIDELGGEPTERFLWDFAPKPIALVIEEDSLKLDVDDYFDVTFEPSGKGGSFVKDLIDPDHPTGEAGVGVKLPAPPPAKKKPSTKEKGTT
tara:strand:- start:1372 stop:1713 length:342 start_codon:yes stop_codon:yes gene_type:complete